MRQRVLPERGLPHRLGFWGRGRECNACSNRQSIRLSFQGAVWCDMCQTGQILHVPIYLYIGMHPAPLSQDGFYIYIYRNAPSSRPYLRYVRKRETGTTYVNVPYVAAHPARSPKPLRRPCRASRTEAFPQSPLPAPKTKAASARSAERRAPKAHARPSLIDIRKPRGGSL